VGRYLENKWTGLVPKEEMPYVINPDKLFVVSANNFMTSTNVLHGTSHSFTYTGRSTRINELLEQAL
jgi:acyl-homoserine lactone acylase PvdQ